MSANAQLPLAIARKSVQLNSPMMSKSSTSTGSRNSSTSSSSSFTSVEDFNPSKIPTLTSAPTTPAKKKLKNLQPALQEVPLTLSSKLPKRKIPSPKKASPGKVTQTHKPLSPAKRVVPVRHTRPQSKVVATPTADKQKHITKGKPLKLAFSQQNGEKESTRVAAKQEHATEAKPLTKGEQLKLNFARENSEREAARTAKREHVSMGLPTAEEMMAQIKIETAARIKKRHEERDRIAQEEKIKNEAARSAAASALSRSAAPAAPPPTNAELIKLRTANDAKRNEEDRAARVAEREALRQDCAKKMRLAAWSPVASLAKQPESQLVIQVQAVHEEIRSEDYLPRSLPRHIQSTTTKISTFTRNRSSCAMLISVPRQKAVVFELEYSDNKPDESPEPVAIALPEYSDGNEWDRSPEPTLITLSEPTESPVLFSHDQQVQNKNIELQMVQNIGDSKTRVQVELETSKAQECNRFGWVNKVIDTRTRQKYPPIVTGFEHLGIYIPDPRSGTPARCASSWGQYLTYPLDNVNMDLHRARHQAIQRCLAYFARERKIRFKQYHFKHEYEHVSFEQHRGFKHDYLCIANTEGPLYNHHRTMSYRNSSFKHDPENCWHCHLAKVPELKTIWEQEDGLQDDQWEEHDGCMIELYDEDGFLIEGNVREFEDAYEREEDFYHHEVGDYQGDAHTGGEETSESGNNSEVKELLEVNDRFYEHNEIHEQVTAFAQVQGVPEMVEHLEADTIPRMVVENQLVQDQNKSSTRLIALKTKTKNAQARYISRIQPTILTHIKLLSPPTLARTTEVFCRVFVAGSLDTTVQLPLQRYFLDLLIDLTRSNNYANISPQKAVPYLQIAAPPNFLVASHATSSISPSIITGLTMATVNGESTGAIKLLTQFSKDNGITRGPVNVVKSWILNMPPCNQVFYCVEKVGKVIGRIFGYVNAASA
ncbi:hypothetical protein DFP73DRAFT_583628 [Morchella snyderi]|nr:hypothetical protein DFP73DRAFT_583628 [Morchella snyderi]